MSVAHTSASGPPGHIHALIEALFGGVGFQLLRGEEPLGAQPLEGPARRIRLAWPWTLLVPADVPVSEAERGLIALMDTCLESHVELRLDALGRVSCAGPVEDLLGLPHGLLSDAPVDAWLRRVHPFDQRLVRQAIEESIPTRTVVRYRSEPSVLRHLELVLETDGEGRLIRLRDVTEVEALRSELASTKRREQALIGAQPDAMLRVRGDGRIIELRPGRTGLPGDLSPMSVGGRISDVLGEPYGGQLERRIGRVVQESHAAVLRMQLDDHWWEARIEPAEGGQVLVLIRDVSGREQLLRELVEARERAESASREKSRFLANMSHEIRTPLHGVLGLTDLLRHTALDIEQAELATAIDGSGQLLLSLLNDLLDYSRIEAGQLDMESTRFDLVQLLEESLEIAAPTAHAKGVPVILDIDPDLPVVAQGDPKRLRQVLVNLVSNAVKFTPEGYVAVRVRAYGDSRIQVEVQDTGIGIAQDAVRHLFDPFAQADSSVARRFGGTGLGLAICRELVGRMEGQIGVESLPGRGSTFRFDIHLELSEGHRDDDLYPLGDLVGRRVALADLHPEEEGPLRRLISSWGVSVVDVSEQPDVVLAAESTVGSQLTDDGAAEVVRLIPWGVRRVGLAVRMPPRREDLLRAIRDALGLESPRDRPEAAAMSLLEGRVLVVDDNPVNRRITKGQLERMGLSVVLADGGRDGLRKAQQHDIDLILMDLQMPDMDGFTATRLIRERGVDVPILALTAGVEEERQRCEAVGMDGQLGKPLDLRQLRSALHRWLDERQSSRRSA